METKDFNPSTNAALAEVGRQLVTEIRELVGAIRAQLTEASPEEAARQTVGDGPEIVVPIEEANVSPYGVNGYPIVRYLLPDGTQVVWRVDATDDKRDPIVQMHVEDPKTGAKWALEFVEITPGDEDDR